MKVKNKVIDKSKSEDETEDKVEDTKISAGPGGKSRKMAKFWLSQIHDFEKSRSAYFSKGDRIVQRYRDNRPKTIVAPSRKMNNLWANIKVMLPAIYSKCPQPIVERMFNDKDPIARAGSIMLERAIKNEIECNGFHKSVKSAVLDYLLPGQGTVWCRYEGEIEDVSSIPINTAGIEDKINDITGEDKQEQNESAIKSEKVIVDYLHWKDVGFLPTDARTWKEVQTVYKGIMISRSEAKKRFGDEIGEAIRPDVSDSQDSKISGYQRDEVKDSENRNLKIYELWNATDKHVYWVSKGYEYLCDLAEDPLGLTDFFPIPEPIFSTYTSDTLVPVPDYDEWKDQAIFIDELTTRIAQLTKACKVAGTYDASNAALGRLLDENIDNKLIPVDGWAAHKEKGGIPGAISLLPLQEIQTVIKTLVDVRKLAMQDLDLITGTNDVMRGTTDSRETLGGIRIKNNTTGTRLSDRQEDIAVFCLNTVKIISEIICNCFSSDKIIKVSGIHYDEEFDPKVLVTQMLQDQAVTQAKASAQQPPPDASQGPQTSPPPGMLPGAPPMGVPPGASPVQPQQMSAQGIQDIMYHRAMYIINGKIEQAIDLLKDKEKKQFRVKIEIDSTVYSDAGQERKDAIEFAETFTKFLQGIETTMQSLPEAMPLAGSMLKFIVRKFRAGRDLESQVETFIDSMTKKSIDLIQNPPPDPKMAAENQKQQFEKDMQDREAKAQADNDARDAQKNQESDARQKQLDDLDVSRQQQELHMEVVSKQITVEQQEQLAQLQYSINKSKLENQMAYEQAKHNIKMQELSVSKKEKTNGKTSV